MTSRAVLDGDAWADDGGYGADADPPADPGYGHRIVGADFDGHNGYVRGICYITATQEYVAISATFSKRYKTLAGAVRRMGRYGYDAYGERLPEEPR